MSESSAPIDTSFLNYHSYAVVGAGMSGRAACEALLERGKSVTLYDDRADATAPELVELSRAGVRMQLGPDATLSGEAAMVISPGISVEHRLVLEARNSGIVVRGELELGYLIGEGRPRIIGITGTNGKTTVTMLCEALLQAGGFRAMAVGNIGVAFTAAVREHREHLDEMVFALEVSSFQLETVDQFRPDVAVVLNITPDHLDRHHTLEDYAAAKARIAAMQGPEQVLVVNQEDALCLKIAAGARARVRRFSLERPVDDGAWVDGDLIMMRRDGVATKRLMAMDSLQMVGLHNVANAMAAACACEQLGLAPGVGKKTMANALKAFKSAPHRMQVAGELDGVTYINDSKATNLDAMRTAIASFAGGVHLIAGGRDKASPWASVAAEVAARVARVYLIGEAAPIIRAAWGGAVECVDCETMAHALVTARAAALPGETILLSPGCASFDQFKSYADRGQQFMAWVQSHLDTHSAKT